MTFKVKNIALIAALLFGAACDGGGGGGGDDNAESRFGAAFAALFGAAPNDEPVDAQSVGLTVDPTADPFNP